MNSIRNNSKKKKNENLFFTAETFGVVLMLFSALCLVCLITGDRIFSLPGKYVADFLFGVFGYLAGAVCFSVLVLGTLMLLGKKINVSVKNKISVTVICLFVSILLHVISMRDFSSLSYSEYLSKAYEMGEEGLKGASAGGSALSLLAYFLPKLLTNTGAYVVISVLIAVSVYLSFAKNNGQAKSKTEEPKLRTSFVKQEESSVDVNPTEERDYPVSGVDFSDGANSSSQRLFVSNPGDFELKTKRELKKNTGSTFKIDYGSDGLGIAKTVDTSYQRAYSKDMEQKLNYVKKPANIDLSVHTAPKKEDEGDVRISKPIKDFYSGTDKKEEYSVNEILEKQDEHKVSDVEKEDVKFDIPLTIHEENSANGSASDHAREFSDKYIDIPEEPAPVEEEKEFTFEPLEKVSTEENFGVKDEVETYSFDSADSFADTERITDVSEETEIIDKKEEDIKTYPIEEPPVSRIRETSRSLFGEDRESEKKAVAFEAPSESRSERSMGFTRNTGTIGREETSAKTVEPATPEPPKKPKVQPPINRKYMRPPLDLLDKHDAVVNEGAENHQAMIELLNKTLEEFHVNAVAQGYVQGPSITRYEIVMAPGVSVRRITGLDEDLRMRLRSKDNIRIEAPIPGKDLVGIEIANEVKTTVGLRELLEDSAKNPSKPGTLMFAIGKDIVGKTITDNLAAGPHFLVAGATGSGKSVCLNVMIVSMIMRYSPEDLRLILIDPKSVEFGIYEHLPHLMIDEIITEPQKAVAVLQWAYLEMENRYATFRACDQRIVDINGYNEKIASSTVARMPRIVIVIDELADLMENCKKDMESKIRALAQKSRAVGIHLVLATQRPSVDIITGTIKTNLPSRIALRVMNYADSSTILGEGGAEKLLGHGDMLYKNSSMSESARYQGAYLTDTEIMNVVEYIKENNKGYFDDELSEFLENSVHPKQEEALASSDDAPQEVGIESTDIFKKSLALAIMLGTISISLLQRHFQIGYSKAGGIVDRMERRKFIGPNENNSKGRKVLITKEEYESLYGEMPEDI